jgi:hypothetical protein
MNNIKGLIPICLEMYIINGTAIKATVSLTKKAERNPIPTTNINKSESMLFALDNIFIATSLITPDLSNAVTILNMPKRNPITSRLIDLSADCKEITCKASISTAPITIETHIGI